MNESDEFLVKYDLSYLRFYSYVTDNFRCLVHEYEVMSNEVGAVFYR